MRYGTTIKLIRPGTIAAVAQPIHEVVVPEMSFTNFAAKDFAAFAVKNIAEIIILL